MCLQVRTISLKLLLFNLFVRSNWKWDLKKHIRQVHPIVDADGEQKQQPAEKILVGKLEEADSLDGNGSDNVEGAAKILVMPLDEARRTVDSYLKQVGKSAEKFLLKCVLCPFVTKVSCYFLFVFHFEVLLDLISL